MTSILKDKKFYFLWISSVLGAAAVLPYASSQVSIALTNSLVLGTLIQATLLYAVLVFFGVKTAGKLDFQIVPQQKYILTSILAGLGIGLALKLLDQLIFKHYANVLLKATPDTELWHGILASFYGAINEEVLLRLFAVSLVSMCLQKITKFSKQKVAIISIIICALIFAFGHLPMLYKIIDIPNACDILRVMVLNSLAGIVFGLLYFRYGLFSAMLSHFMADLVIHVFWVS